MSAFHSTATAEAILFDMDGTLLDSTPAVESTWKAYADKYGLDLTEILNTSHGVRTIDNLRRFSGSTDEQELLAEVEQFELNIALEAERLKREGQDGLILLPGVEDLLLELNKAETPVWAIVTSATSIYAQKAIPAAGVLPPPHLITGDMCQRGKPDPEPYTRGAAIVGVAPEKCIVVEDAPSGIRAGVAAGCRVLAVCTSHTRAKLEDLGAEWIVSDLSKVKAAVQGQTVQLQIDESK